MNKHNKNIITPCPVCNEKEHLKSFKWNKQEIISCQRCALDFCPIIIQKESDSDSSPTPKEHLKMLKDTFKDIQKIADQRCNARILIYKLFLGNPVNDVIEIGCGPGVFYSPFTKNSIAWRGLEVNPLWIKWGISNNIPIEKESISNYKKCFDLIFACQVLEHLEEPHRFLEDIIGALRPGGLVHFEVPNQNSFISKLRKISPLISSDYGFIHPPGHMRAYCTTTLKHLFNYYDMKIKLLSVYPNDHIVWGQVHLQPPLINRIGFRISEMLGQGSLLVGIAQKQ